MVRPEILQSSPGDVHLLRILVVQHHSLQAPPSRQHCGRGSTLPTESSRNGACGYMQRSSRTPEMTESVLCLSTNPSWFLLFSTLDNTIGVTRLASQLARADVIGLLPLLGVKKRAMDLRNTELGHTLFY